MSTSITTIQSTDLITNSRADINNNFDSLLVNKLETSVLDTDTTLAANSDAKVATQKAVKAYVDAGGNADIAAAQAGGGDFGTPSASNKFVTEDKLTVNTATIMADIATTSTVASSNLQHSNDTAVVHSSSTAVKTHEVQLGRPIYRLRATGTITRGDASQVGWQLRKNGTTIASGGPAAGTLTMDTSPTESFTTGDLVQFYNYYSGGGPTTTTADDFRLYYDDVITEIAGLALDTPLVYDGSGLAAHTNTLP